MKLNINKLSQILFLALFATFFAFNLANAQDKKPEEAKKEENIGDIILHHVGDSQIDR